MISPIQRHQLPVASGGFTLVEVITVIAILAILTSMALPGYRTLVLNSKQRAASNELQLAMNAARNEAVKQQRDVVVCAADSVAAGCIGSGAGVDWSQGVLVFVDEDSDQALDADESVVYFGDGYGEGLDSVSGPGALTFRPFNVRSDAGTITICDSRGAAHARAVIVAVSGRAFVARPDDAGFSPTCA